MVLIFPEKISISLKKKKTERESVFMFINIKMQNKAHGRNKAQIKLKPH